MTCQHREPLAPPNVALPLQGLEHYDPQWLALHNRLHRRRQPWQSVFAGQPVKVTWSTAQPLLLPTHDVRFSLGDASLVVRMPAQWLESLGGVSADVQDPATPMLLELALLDLIEPVERLSGQTLEVVELAHEGEPDLVAHPLHVTLLVQLGEGAALPVPLHLSVEAARLMADLLEQHASADRHPVSALRMRLAVEHGEALLSLGELRSLRAGDVLMLDGCPGDSPVDGPDHQVRLVLPGRLHARATSSGEGIRLLEPLIATHFAKDIDMTESAIGPDLDSTLDELPMKLVCQVGSVELSLAQLRELGEGSLLPLAAPTGDGVDLMVNGRRIGQGQLVKIGDGLGVRLLSFTAP
jgi:type III secretion protein Q